MAATFIAFAENNSGLKRGIVNIIVTFKKLENVQVFDIKLDSLFLNESLALFSHGNYFSSGKPMKHGVATNIVFCINVMIHRGAQVPNKPSKTVASAALKIYPD